MFRSFFIYLGKAIKSFTKVIAKISQYLYIGAQEFLHFCKWSYPYIWNGIKKTLFVIKATLYKTYIIIKRSCVKIKNVIVLSWNKFKNKYIIDTEKIETLELEINKIRTINNQLFKELKMRDSNIVQEMKKNADYNYIDANEYLGWRVLRIQNFIDKRYYRIQWQNTSNGNTKYENVIKNTQIGQDLNSIIRMRHDLVNLIEEKK